MIWFLISSRNTTIIFLKIVIRFCISIHSSHTTTVIPRIRVRHNINSFLGMFY
jgi:hypothetical protein